MIPILYEKNETSFTTNGIGRLMDTTRCICTEERNGEYEIELEYAVSGKLFDEIKHSRIIVAKPSQNEPPQAFRIYKISKPMMNGLITVNAHHISYQLNNIPVSPFSASSLSVSLQMLKSHSMENNPFTFSTDKSSTVPCGMSVPTMCRSMMGGHEGSILDRYGGEWHFDNYTCELLNARGSDNGVTIRYGKNLTDLEQEENIENTYTGIVPFWQASDSDECVYASAVYASTADAFPFHKTNIIDFSQNFDAKPTSAELTTIAQQYIVDNNIGHPVVSLNVNFIDLANSVEYKDIAPLETISLCDTVTVIFEKLGIEEKAKVVRTEWDVLNEKYESIQIGSIQTSLATTIAGQGAAIEENLSKAREFTRDATGWLTNGAGYVIANKNPDGSWKELLFLDKPTTAAATKVLRINENGIGFASGAAGTFDSWVYYQAWTLDGNLSLGGVNNSYGRLRILNPSGTQIGVWDKDGIKIYDSNNVLIFSVNDDNIRFFSPGYNSTTYISGATEGVRVVDQYNEAMVTSGEISVEDLTDGAYAAILGGVVSAVDESGGETYMMPSGMTCSDGTDESEMRADGFYVNGVKIATNTSGYTGSFDIVTDIDVDFDNEDYSADVYTLTFENGVLKNIT